MQRLGRLDLRMYAEAFPLLVRTPALFLAPLATGIIGIFFQMFGSVGTGNVLGGMTGGLTSLIVDLLNMFGLAVSVIVADYAWRRGRATFDEAWVDARRKAGDILLAALGVTFVTYVAQMAGSLLAPVVGLVLFAVAFYFLIYTIAAAAIGGVPGGAALSLSIDRVRANYIAAFFLVVTYIVLLYFVGALIPIYLGGLGIAAFIIAAAIKSVMIGYFALVLAKNYAEGSYGYHY